MVIISLKSRSSDEATGAQLLAANLAMLGNNFCASLGVLLQKPLNPFYTSTHIITVTYMVAAAGLGMIVG